MATALETPRPEPARMPRMHDPDSMTIRCAADIRMQLMGGRTFVMQVAHPAVGAGVHEFSEFRNDPWTRLEQIAKSGTQYLYRGEAAAHEEGRRLQPRPQGHQGRRPEREGLPLARSEGLRLGPHDLLRLARQHARALRDAAHATTRRSASSPSGAKAGASSGCATRTCPRASTSTGSSTTTRSRTPACTRRRSTTS